MTPTAVRRKVVLYLRISYDPLAKEVGVESQDVDCRALANTLAWEVVRVFRENDTSAFKQRTVVLPGGERVRRVVRPMFREMLAMLEAGEADAMMAYDLDRAVRDPRDLEDLIDARVLYGFEVRSVTGSLRLDSDADVAMARVMVAMANKSSADTARRVKRACLTQAEDGRWHGGRAPFGYRINDSSLEIVEDQAAMVRTAVDGILQGRSPYSIIRDWNETGRLTQQGKLWEVSTLCRLLRNPALVGIRTYRTARADGTHPYREEPALVTLGNWQPLVDRESWDRVNATLDARSFNRAAGKSNKRLYPFSGLIICAKCGTKMRKRGGGYACQAAVRGVCRREVNFEEVNSFIEEAVLGVLGNTDLRLGELDEGSKDTNLQTLLAERLHDFETASEALSTRRSLGAEADESLVDIWPHQSPAWQNSVAKLVLRQVRVLEHPAGHRWNTPKRKAESDQEHRERRASHRVFLLTQRIVFDWVR